MIELDDIAWAALIATAERKNVYISGSILRLLDTSGSALYEEYVDKALEKDADRQRRRLDVNKKTQLIMKELKKAGVENERLMEDLKEALSSAEEQRQVAETSKIEADKLREEAENARRRAEMARETAELELDVVQKKKQFQLVGYIVKVALAIICGVGVVTTVLYAAAIYTGSTEATLLGNTWSNMFGILLTNSFSIIGTIMGVKYATERSGDSEA